MPPGNKKASGGNKPDRGGRQKENGKKQSFTSEFDMLIRDCM